MWKGMKREREREKTNVESEEGRETNGIPFLRKFILEVESWSVFSVFETVRKTHYIP